MSSSTCVNAADSPRDAGYLAAEIQVLKWIGKPVPVLLNQVGPPRPDAEEAAERDLWHATSWSTAQCDVLTLDAFARCWVQEGTLLRGGGRRLSPDKRRLSIDCGGSGRTNLERFEACMQVLAGRRPPRRALPRRWTHRSGSVGACMLGAWPPAQG